MSKKKQTNRIKRIKEYYKTPKNIIVTVIVVSIVVVGLFLFANRITDVDKISMTYNQVFDTELLKQNVNTNIKQSYQLRDYTIYGENLVLYEDEYCFEPADKLMGKNVLLRNIETQEEMIFTFSGGVDSGIDLSQLNEGVYELYIYDHYKQKRVYFSKEFESDKFTTMRRNGSVKTVTLNTNRDFLSEIGVLMEKNYAFLTVIDNTPVSSIYDVVIDPCGNAIDISSNAVNPGYSNNRISERESSYELALALKEDLEAYGLRVMLTRDADEEISYYGTSGRAGKAYESKAKVFIALGMTADETIIEPYIIASPYTNGIFGNEMASAMARHDVDLSTVSIWARLLSGVCFDGLMKDDFDELQQWEMLTQLRETGGKSTFAGTLDVAVDNQPYTYSYGLHGIFFTYANISKKKSIEYYEEHKEQIAEALADGIVEYFRIYKE